MTQARDSLKKLVWRSQALAFRVAGRAPGKCVACQRNVSTFLPFRSGTKSLSPFLRDLALVGSDLERFRCPRCGSTDRERHLLAYVRAKNLFQDPSQRVLHFAPEPYIQAFLMNTGTGRYVRADLFPRDAEMERVDITAMPYGDASFDVVIANHVLEHVDKPAAALSEIHRVLGTGGIAILQTPFAGALQSTIELPVTLSPESRMEVYGQEDHVRLFGLDIFTRVEAAGFVQETGTHEALLPDVDAGVHGMNANEPFMCFRKP